jgi:putative nucleotidyltransferase with HDIG domain
VHRLRRQGHVAALSEFGTTRHLARRFAATLRPGGPGTTGEAWARNWLSATETAIWAGMSGPDRRHAVGVAHRVAAAAGNTDGAGVARNLIAAALLHDAGKQAARLGAFGRSAATIAAVVGGREKVAAWSCRRSGYLARAGLYVSHDKVGSEMLRQAGSDPLVVAWASEHHRPAASWSVEPSSGDLLKAADDD